MSLQEKTKNIKYFKRLTEHVDLSLILSIVLMAYFLGSMSVILGEVHDPIVIKANQFQDNNLEETESKNIMASRSGTKYYYLWCSGVNRIKEENRVWFSTAEEARGAGYEKSKNCPGE